MKVIQEIKYLRSYYYHWDDTSVGGLLVPEGIIISVVNVSALVCIIIYIYVWLIDFVGA
jgi:hypothetical protein